MLGSSAFSSFLLIIYTNCFVRVWLVDLIGCEDQNHPIASVQMYQKFMGGTLDSIPDDRQDFTFFFGPCKFLATLWCVVDGHSRIHLFILMTHQQFLTVTHSSPKSFVLEKDRTFVFERVRWVCAATSLYMRCNMSRIFQLIRQYRLNTAQSIQWTNAAKRDYSRSKLESALT